MIVAFVPTAEEAEGREDGGLQPATLRALTCAAELGERFGEEACHIAVWGHGCLV